MSQSNAANDPQRERPAASDADALPAEPPSLGGLLLSHMGTLIGCAVLLFCGVFQYANPFLGLFVLILVPLTIYNVVRIIFRPKERKGRLLALSMWALTIGIVFAVQSYRDAKVRRVADDVLVRVKSHHQKVGQWPARLEEVELDSVAMKREWQIYYAGLSGETPLLMYKASWNLFDRYYYDFAAGEWKFKSD